MPTYVRGGGAAMRLVFLLLNLCGVSAAELVPGSVAFVTTSDCKGVTNWRSHGGSGAQFPASLASLMRMKEVFPTWDGFLITSQWKQPACTETFEQFQRKYAQTFQGAKLGKLVLNRNEIKVLDHIASSGGKETDHSRGHWPMEAYMHLVSLGLWRPRESRVVRSPGPSCSSDGATSSPSTSTRTAGPSTTRSRRSFTTSKGSASSRRCRRGAS
mmetsp:Transcript_8436/g.29031  ORF Transcript_8436/g.29031 Transcript_8436/m.29031 type:complete len:214 (-) Transcript_8436:531-1172(-)